MNHVIFRWLNKCIIVIFFLILSLIAIVNMFDSSGYNSVELNAPPFFNGLTLLLALLMMGMIKVFHQNILEGLNRIPTWVFVITLLAASFVMQIQVVRLFTVHPTWDFGVIVSESKNLLETGTLGGYFEQYPNNILLVCILAVVSKIFSPEIIVYQFFNIAVILLSHFFIFRISTKVAGENAGKISLLVSVFFFPYIFYAPIVYTDTISLIFLLIPLNLLFDSDGRLKRCILIILISSVFLALGMILKGSLVVFIIALTIVLFLFAEKWRKLLAFLPIIILILLRAFFNNWIYDNHILNKEQVEKYSFPITHWFVMGQNEWNYGKFSSEDVEWTANLLKTEPREEVSKTHLEELKMRLEERGFYGNLQFHFNKISHTWTDGTYYSLNKLRRAPIIPENFTSLINFKSGLLLQSFARLQHLIIIGGLFLFIRNSWKRNDPFYSFAMLSVIGFFFFFIIWEARSRYILSLSPLLIILGCKGYFGFKPSIRTNNEG